MFNKLKLEQIKQECENKYKDLKDITLCFTGHRSQKLPWRFNEDDERCVKMKNSAKELIEQAIIDGYVYFISGMALGFDMICAEIVLELKKKYPHIKLICALPCKNQDELWTNEYKKRYKKILKQADSVRCLADKYTRECMLERNNYMLNNSSRVIALFNGLSGGTKSTIAYAKKQGKEVVVIKP